MELKAGITFFEHSEANCLRTHAGGAFWIKQLGGKFAIKTWCRREQAEPRSTFGVQCSIDLFCEEFIETLREVEALVGQMRLGCRETRQTDNCWPAASQS